MVAQATNGAVSLAWWMSATEVERMALFEAFKIVKEARVAREDE
jgi:hypothetical protein